MKNIGVILAGGSGRRLGSELPKQFIVIAGKTVLAHTRFIHSKNMNILMKSSLSYTKITSGKRQKLFALKDSKK